MYSLGGFSWSGVSGDKTFSSRGEADYWVVLINDKESVRKIPAAASNENIKVINNNDFSMYPNPAKDIVNISHKGKAEFVLTNQYGKPMLKKVIENNAVISVAGFAAGVYYLKNMLSGAMQKIVVQK